MASTLTWLDYSERDRRRALDVIDLFRETGTVDELGLASVRDSFSDLFFPGTSTIQTRACYFLLVPWTFMRLERLEVESSKVESRARAEELHLNSRMLTSSDTRGVFGAMAGDTLKRLPSGVYWGGLGSWGIRAFSGHMWAYFRSLDGFYRRRTQFHSMRRDPEGRSAPPTNWHPHLPSPPSGFPFENVSVALRPEDANYLRDRIQARHPENLLAVLAGRADPMDLNVNKPWQLIQIDELPPALRVQLNDAELFAVCTQGAALLYNLMLSELQDDEKRVETYKKKLKDWAVDIESLEPSLSNWRLDGILRVVRAQGRSVGYPTKAFLESWIENLKLGGSAAVVSDNYVAQRLVREREVQLKRGRARLTSRRHLELWGGQSGTGRMDYRWGVSKRILTDMFDGLARTKDDAGNA